mmetsp:Transcript_40005/g.127926  ORF Transcript_40005/g.127926 Transcript_40005/m.127926 type:complete len:216 (+) Transcript_40005:119-766(+)
MPRSSCTEQAARLLGRLAWVTLPRLALPPAAPSSVPSVRRRPASWALRCLLRRAMSASLLPVTGRPASLHRDLSPGRARRQSSAVDPPANSHAALFWISSCACCTPAAASSRALLRARFFWCTACAFVSMTHDAACPLCSSVLLNASEPQRGHALLSPRAKASRATSSTPPSTTAFRTARSALRARCSCERAHFSCDRLSSSLSSFSTLSETLNM